MINKELIKLARQKLVWQTKQAVQPPMPPDPSMGGGMPPDPSMGGGMPPDPSMGGMPPDPAMMGMPPDPSMGGGMPPDPSMMGMPPDPSMMGGAPPVPGGGGLTADTIRQVMQETLGQLGMVPGQAGPGGGAAGGKPGKPDLLAMSMDIFQLKKMTTAIMNALGVPMPQDVLDGPNRDPATGSPMPPGAPGSTSDPNKPPDAPMSAGMEGGNSAIKPIGQLQGAFPSGGGSEKLSSSKAIIDKAAALNTILRKKLNQSVRGNSR